MSSNHERGEKKSRCSNMPSPASPAKQHPGRGAGPSPPPHPDPPEVLRKQQQREESDEREDGDRPSNNLMAGAVEKGGCAGWASYLTFSWPGRLLDIGSTSANLSGDDLDGIFESHKSQHLCDILRCNWENETAKVGDTAPGSRARIKGISLLRALFVTYRGRLVLSGAIFMAENAFMVIQAVTLGWLIGYFGNARAASWEGWVYASAVVVSGIASSVCHHHFLFVGEVLGMQMKVSTTTLLYEKILRLRLSSLGEVTAGHLVNLATTDVERFQFCAMFINCLWGAPLAALITLAVGLQVIGVSLLVGFAALFMLIPLQAVFSRKFTTVRQRVAALTDERVKLTNQVITGARLMKLNAWEPALEKEIKRVRAEETRFLKKATLLRAVNEAMFFVQPAFLGCLVFATYHLLGNELTPSKVFTTLALLNDTQFTMGKFFCLAVQSASESWVSTKRFERVLLMAENKHLQAPSHEKNTAATGDRGEQRTTSMVTNGLAPCNADATSTAMAPISNVTATDTETLLPLLHAAAASGANGRNSAPGTASTPGSTPNYTVGTKGREEAAAYAATTKQPFVPTVGATGAKSAVELVTVPNHLPYTTFSDGKFAAALHTEGTGLSATAAYRLVTNGGVGASPERPGHISMKRACFRWTNRLADDEPANALQRLPEGLAEPVDQPSNQKGSIYGGKRFTYSGKHVRQTSDDNEGMALRDINLDIEPGALVGIVGPVGSSKSSLLMAVLQELSPEHANGMGSAFTPVSGQVSAQCEKEGVSVAGTVAYASQEPWIQSGTLRDNIIFGRRMDRERYESVLRDCSLERDLSLLPSGDMTGIGDRGVNLSGGQRARVGLARMSYAHADIYLMDDPLSAVDPAVGRELFSRVVCGRLSGRTRVLVTHQVHHLSDPAVDAIIVMDKGKIVARGSYDELETRGIFAALERSVTTPGSQRKGAETAPGLDSSYGFEPSTETNSTTTSPSRYALDEAPLGFGTEGCPALNPFPKQQQQKHQHQQHQQHQHQQHHQREQERNPQTADCRHHPGDVDNAGKADKNCGSSYNQGADRDLLRPAQNGNGVRHLLRYTTDGIVSSTGRGDTEYSSAKGLLSRLSFLRPSAASNALRYEKIEPPCEDEAVGSHEREVEVATGNFTDPATLYGHENTRSVLASPLPDTGTSSPVRNQAFYSPGGGSVRCNEETEGREGHGLAVEAGTVVSPVSKGGERGKRSAFGVSPLGLATPTALRYRALTCPGVGVVHGTQEVGGSEERILATETEDLIDRAAADGTRRKPSMLRSSDPVSAGSSSALPYRNLMPPHNCATGGMDDAGLGDGEERTMETDGLIGCVSQDKTQRRSSMFRSESPLPMLSTPVGHEGVQGLSRPEPSPELVVAECNESGELQHGTYREYLKEAGGAWQLLLILISMAGGQVLVMWVTVWLAKWSHQTRQEQQRARYLTILVLLTLAATVVSLVRAVITFASLVEASRRLHDRMLKAVIGAPILFFDSNPIGRILNRFTKDMDCLDDLLPMTAYDFTTCTFMAVGGTLLVFVVNPWVVLSMLPSASYFWYLQGFYVKTSREVKRLDAMTRSPVYSQLSETLDGLVTIRSFGMQRRFLEQFNERVDLNTRAYFACLSTTRWLGFRLHMVMTIILIASCFFSVAVHEYSGSVDAGLLGAALVYTIQLGGLFQWAVKQSAELENQMVSTERVLNYCKVPQEARLEFEAESKPPDDWPTKGNIEIHDLFLRYREDLPPALKGLNLSILGGSRVGVVGRTGAGKSSLIAALFRLVEYDRARGGVKIDDVDISRIGLHDLRLKMSVVPQTPFLFSGSMRLNLDPFKTQSDMDMWAALEAVQMKGYVQGLPEGLDAPVSEGGGNLSVGQRQLLCLARAVLQRSQILVMDEATANIDQNTDSLIQDVVRTKFKGRTVIMIAHRLNTVIDCDQVVVFSEGRVVEAGHPHLLLQASTAAAAAAACAAATTIETTHHANGMSAAERGATELTPARADATLSSMVDETGPANSENLRCVARESWEASTSI